VIIRIDVDGSRGYENEGWIDIDGEFDVAVFISVEFEFSLLLIVIESFIIFLLFILHLICSHDSAQLGRWLYPINTQDAI
jgi:hypothetical protein